MHQSSTGDGMFKTSRFEVLYLSRIFDQICDYVALWELRIVCHSPPANQLTIHNIKLVQDIITVAMIQILFSRQTKSKEMHGSPFSIWMDPCNH